MQAGVRDYQELSFSRTALKRLYALTLTLTLLLALTSALGLAVVLSERFASPLGLLAEGTRAVAQGDFTRRQPVVSRDELGVLTESFNTMTAQLAEAQGTAEESRRAIETTRAYLESILGNLSAGVLVFDDRHRLRTVESERRGDSAAAAGRADRHVARRVGQAIACARAVRRARLRRLSRQPRRPVAEGSGAHGREPVAHAADARNAAAGHDGTAATWWSSTTCPSSCRRSATPRGRKSRGVSRTRSRIH